MNKKFQTPIWGTVIYGVLSVVWYVGLTALSENVLADSIATLGLMIAFYYGINGIVSPMLYRNHIFKSIKQFLLLALLPVLGALVLFWALVKSMIDFTDPANSESGSSWFGVGPPFVLGFGFLFLGIILMLVWWGYSKDDFFKRKLETVDSMAKDSLVIKD